MLARVQAPAASAPNASRPLFVTFAVGTGLIAALWGVLLQQATAERAEAARSNAQQQVALAVQVAEHLRQTISLADQLAQLVREEAGADFVNSRNFYSGIAIVNSAGYLVPSLQTGAPLQVAAEPYFARQKDNPKDVAIVDILHPKHAEHMTQLVVSRRIIGADGSFGGVVAIFLDSAYFDHELERLGAGTQDALLLLRPDGTVLGRDRATDLPAAVRLIEQQPDALGLLQYGGRRWAMHPVADLGYAAVGRFDPTLHPLRDPGGKYYLTGVVLTALVACVTLGTAWLANRTRDALLRLQDSERRANAANELKSSFVAKISHDLRTPLNGIVGFADLLREAGSNDQERVYAGHIYDSATHLHSLVDQILDIAKIEAGAAVLNRSEVELVPLLRGLADLHRVAAQAKQLTLELEIGRETPFQLRCDEVRLRQMLGNLLHNAVKFTDRGGVVLRADRCPDGVLFEVRDSGAGIPPAALPDLFTTFHQADTGTSRRDGGSGLGLAITKELVELHDGQILVESTVGVGAVFRIVLPQ